MACVRGVKAASSRFTHLHAQVWNLFSPLFSTYLLPSRGAEASWV